MEARYGGAGYRLYVNDGDVGSGNTNTERRPADHSGVFWFPYNFEGPVHKRIKNYFSIGFSSVLEL